MRAIRARLDTHLLLRTDELGEKATKTLKGAFTRSNPLWFKKKRLDLWLGETPRELKSWTVEGRFMILPRGSLEKVEEILAGEFGIRLDPVIDKTVKLTEVDFEIRTGEELRPYQSAAVEFLAEEEGGLVRGDPGSGKTVILLGAIARLRQPAIVVVHSNALKKQWEFEALRWLGIVAGSIGSGRKMRLAPLTIATQQSLWYRVKHGDIGWAGKFGTLVGDEIHRWAARTFAEVASTFPAAFRIGASADERRKDGMEHVVYETFGSRVHKIKRDALVADGKLLPIKMEIVPTNYSDSIYLSSVATAFVCPDCKGKLITPPLRKKTDRRKFCRECDIIIDPEVPDWVGMISRLVVDEERNEQIFRHVRRVIDASPDNRILILNEQVKPCRQWAARLHLEDIPTGLLLGGPENRRELARTVSGINTGSLRVAIGTPVADEGLDLPPISHVFMTCPVHTHPKRLKQMAGRGARPHGKLEWATCVYFWDWEMFPSLWPGRDPTEHSKEKESFIRRLKRSADRVQIFEPWFEK